MYSGLLFLFHHDLTGSARSFMAVLHADIHVSDLSISEHSSTKKDWLVQCQCWIGFYHLDTQRTLLF